jgi:hypothetical protein
LTKSQLRLITPATEKRTVIPKRRPNADLQTLIVLIAVFEI